MFPYLAAGTKHFCKYVWSDVTILLNTGSFPTLIFDSYFLKPMELFTVGFDVAISLVALSRIYRCVCMHVFVLPRLSFSFHSPHTPGFTIMPFYHSSIFLVFSSSMFLYQLFSFSLYVTTRTMLTLIRLCCHGKLKSFAGCGRKRG